MQSSTSVNWSRHSAVKQLSSKMLGSELCTGMYSALVAVLLLLLITPWLRKKKKTQQDDDKEGAFPPGPPGWPILGHLPLLTTAPHRELADLSRKHGYGPILGLRLGSVPAVVVSSVALAKEVLHTQDKILANRPHYQLADDLFYGYNSAVILSSYNPRWALMRKIFTLELLSAKRLQQLQHIRQDEVRCLLDRLRQDSHGGKQAVDVRKLLADTTANTTARLLQSKTLTQAAMGLPELVRHLEAEGTFPSLGDFVPCLKFLDIFSARRRRRIHRRIDNLMESILRDRRQLMAHCPPHELPHDFLQVLMSKEGSIEDEEHLTTHEIKAIILDLFGGGVHTSAVTLEWAIAELLKNPECMKNLQKEVDAVMGSRPQGELVKDEDVVKMPYLVDTVKEVLRLHPVFPMVIPRMASQECKLGKYVVPKGATVVVNSWAIATDPVHWPDKPEEFRPERFQSKPEVDVRGHDYELLPFGGGRRVCPGIRLGLSVVHVTLANLVRSFHLVLPAGQTPSSMDMLEKGGIANSKAVPTFTIPTCRN